jgi:hypothetical protein
MRLVLASIVLALAGCGPAQKPQATARDLTVGMEQCRKFDWGTGPMAACLDRAAASQSATVSETKGGDNG